MANQNDSFIDEVTSDLRRDRFFNAMKNYGWIVILAIILIVGGAAWWEFSKNRDAKKAQAWGDQVIAAQKEADPAAALLAIDPDGSEGRKAIADMLAAGALAGKGDAAKSASDYKAAADAVGTDDRIIHDLALLKSVMTAGSSMGAADRDAALTELSKPGAPFELMALEQKAIALVAAGRDEDAVTLIHQIQNKDGLTQNMSRRLTELLVTLGIDPAAEPDAPQNVLPETPAN